MNFFSVASMLFSGKPDYTIQEGFVARIFFFVQKGKKKSSRGMIFIRGLYKNCAGMAITQLHHPLNSLCYVNSVKCFWSSEVEAVGPLKEI